VKVLIKTSLYAPSSCDMAGECDISDHILVRPCNMSLNESKSKLHVKTLITLVHCVNCFGK